MSLTKKSIHKQNSLADFETFEGDEDFNVELLANIENKPTENIASGIFLFLSNFCSMSEERGLVVTVPVKSIVITAITTLAGTFLGVPGIAVGFIAGTVLSYRNSEFRSKNSNQSSPKKKYTIRQLINEMPAEQKKELLRELLKCLNQSSVRLLFKEIVKSREVRNIALSVFTDFLMKRMGVGVFKPN